MTTNPETLQPLATERIGATEPGLWVQKNKSGIWLPAGDIPEQEGVGEERRLTHSLPDVDNIVYVMNRLPSTAPGGGGAMVAGKPITLLHGETKPVPVTWIGAHYTADQEAVDNFANKAGDHFRAIGVHVPLHEEEAHKKSFSDTILWFLNHADPDSRFHSAAREALSSPEARRDFEIWDDVQRKMARVTSSASDESSIIFLNDYHNYTTAKHLRDIQPDALIALYVHTPFMAPRELHELDAIGTDVKQTILEGMIANNVVGFSTDENRRNFIECVKSAFPDGYIFEEENVSGKDYVYVRDLDPDSEHVTVLAVTPIGINPTEFEQAAKSEIVQDEVNEIRKSYGKLIISGLGRLEPTKATSQAAETLYQLYRANPNLQGLLNYILVAAAGRDTAPYVQEEKRLETAVRQLRLLDRPGWQAIHRLPGLLQFPLTGTETLPSSVIGLNGATDIHDSSTGVDGYRLVPLEYLVTSPETGIVVLSEGAGAARYLDGAILVDPHDAESRAEGLRIAMNMPNAERRRRHELGVTAVRSQDVFNHYDLFLEAAGLARKRRG